VKAVRFYGAGKSLKLEDVEIPKISDTEVLVKVKAAGICHTDLHFLDGTLAPWKGSLPLTLGHEVAGEIDSVGKKVTRFRKGERVVVNNGVSCGKCKYCKKGRENLCLELDQLGFTLDGGYAEYMKAPERTLLRLPKGASYETGALLPCGVASSYHALMDIAQLRKGETLLINGTGGLGSGAIQIAKTAGAKVIAVDVIDEKLEMAKRLGADEAVNSKTQDLGDTVKRATEGRGVDVALELVGTSAAMRNALGTLGKTGRYVIVGYTKDMLEVAPLNLVILEAQIRGAVAYTMKDLQAVLRLVQRGKLKPVVARKFGLDEVSSALELLRQGSIAGRSIAVP
jgi:propanol-preferring alcohol dehydrogenase